LVARNEVILELTLDPESDADAWLTGLRTRILAAGLIRLEMVSHG
jgi:hypothetical protein